MPIVEKEATEEELRAQIDRLDQLIARNPTNTADFARRKKDVQRDLNLLLLSQPGYEVVKVSK